MRVRARASLLIGGALLVVGLTGATADAAGVYPPAGLSGCAGPTGIGIVSASVVQVGGTSVLSACGFAPGTSVAIAVNGSGVGSTTAGSDGTFSVPRTFSTAGEKSLTGTGAEGASSETGSARSHGSVSSALATGADVRSAAFLAGTRVVTGSVLVVGGAAVAAGAPPTGGDNVGWLPFTGAQTALLAVVALALIGGGTSLVLVTRRRRRGDTATS